jgi:hypothetical protein
MADDRPREPSRPRYVDYLRDVSSAHCDEGRPDARLAKMRDRFDD